MVQMVNSVSKREYHFDKQWQSCFDLLENSNRKNPSFGKIMTQHFQSGPSFRKVESHIEKKTCPHFDHPNLWRETLVPLWHCISLGYCPPSLKLLMFQALRSIMISMIRGISDYPDFNPYLANGIISQY